MWLIDLIVALLYYLFLFMIAGGIVFGIYLRLKRRKEYMSLSDEHKLVLAEGKQNVKEYRLRNFFSTDGGNKMFREGKILACITAEEENPHKTNWVILAVRRKLLNPMRFYKIQEEYINNLIGDVKSNKWNFRLDDKSHYYILNEKPLLIHEEIVDKTRVGIDTIANISPTINHAILLNADHRIRMREHKLIKESTNINPAIKDLSPINRQL